MITPSRLQHSNYEIALDRVDRMLEFASASENSDLPLPVSALIYLVAVLEQALDTVLNKSTASALSLRARLSRAPKLRSDGAVELAEGTAEVDALHWAITIRNRLMHLDAQTMDVPLEPVPDPLVIRPAGPMTPEEKAMFELAQAALANVSAEEWNRRTADAWEKVPLERVRAARDAIEDYLRSIGELHPEGIRLGRCLRMCR